MTKKTMAIVSVFMVVALTAVGFAAWLIVGTVDGQTTGSFVSNELQDKYFKVEVQFDTTNDENNGKIIFGRPTSGSSQNGDWLTFKNDDAEQKLTAVATIKFIPDGGFSKVLGQEKEMDYYLLDDETKDSEGTVTSRTYRTIRVQLDIAEVLGNDGSETSSNYQWFDMAVQLGYIQYPTAHLIQKDEGSNVLSYDDSQKLAWDTDAENPSSVDYQNFANGYLAIELTYDMFEIQYAEDSDVATEATAQIQIDFNWGSAVSKITTPDNPETQGVDESVITYYNPYPFFNSFTPESAVKVNKYLGSTGGVLQIKDTTEYDDAETTDVIEGYTNEDAKTIRYKDLAERMLSYLSNYINYVPADTQAGTEESGIQFSVTLLEGTLQVVNLPAQSN